MSIGLKFEIIFLIGWLVLAVAGWLVAFAIRLPFPRRMRGPFLLVLSHLLGAVAAIVVLFVFAIALPQLRANGFTLAAAACVQPGLLAADLARQHLRRWWKWLAVLAALAAGLGLARLNVDSDTGRARLMARAAMTHFYALELREPVRLSVYDALGKSAYFRQRRAEVLDANLPRVMQAIGAGDARGARAASQDIMSRLWALPLEQPALIGQAPDAALIKLAAARRRAFETLAASPELCNALLFGQQDLSLSRDTPVSADQLRAVAAMQVALIEAAAAGHDSPAKRDPAALDPALNAALNLRMHAALPPPLVAASKDPGALLLLPPAQKCELGRRWIETVTAQSPANQAQLMAYSIAGNLPPAE